MIARVQLTVVLMSVASAVCELAGVGLVVSDLRRGRRRWRKHLEEVQAEEAAYAADVRWQLDELYARHRIRPSAIHRTNEAVRDLFEIDLPRQTLAVALLAAGILTGASANVLGALAS